MELVDDALWQHERGELGDQIVALHRHALAQLLHVGLAVSADRPCVGVGLGDDVGPAAATGGRSDPPAPLLESRGSPRRIGDRPRHTSTCLCRASASMGSRTKIAAAAPPSSRPTQRGRPEMHGCTHCWSSEPR